MKRLLFFVFLILCFSCISCQAEKPTCKETRPLNIVPGVSIGEFQLGITEKEVVGILCSGYTRKSEKAIIGTKETLYYFIKNMSFIIRNGKLQEINVWGDFKGSFEEIDVDYDKNLLETFGDVVIHKGEYRVLNLPGIAFGLEDSDTGKYIRVFN
jgi:hypothetical protein